MLFQHDHVDAGAREQEAEHHAGRPAAGDAACGGDLLQICPFVPTTRLRSVRATAGSIPPKRLADHSNRCCRTAS